MAEKTGKKKRARIVVKKEWCKSCRICVEFCPRNVLAMKDGYPEVVDLEACTQCQLCELLCPDFAIEVFDEGDLD
ncbi:MAG: ferredoxin family protein [bacterium]